MVAVGDDAGHPVYRLPVIGAGKDEVGDDGAQNHHEQQRDKGMQGLALGQAFLFLFGVDFQCLTPFRIPFCTWL